MAKQGKFIAGTTPYGYKLDEKDKHHLVIDTDEAKIVKTVFNMALDGFGKIKIYSRRIKAFLCYYIR